MKNKLLEVRNLTKSFQLNKNTTIQAVDDVSFSIYENETLGIVGESGCGKTTLGKTILRLNGDFKGQVIYDGSNISKLNKKELLNFRKEAQIILQDPYSSLNPRMSVADIIAEGMEAHKIHKGVDRWKEISKLLNVVGLTQEHASRFPHEFSGGQRQRIGIARTLAVEPKFIVCDEPISALDVSIQSQIINLLIDLQKEFGLTYLFIAHDLSIVRHISDRVGVMYLGNIVELAKSEDLYNKPKHPYTKALLSAIPSLDLESPVSSRRIKIKGEACNSLSGTNGCKFFDRCYKKMPQCQKLKPKLTKVDKNHYVSCLLYE